jgi:hypothetical protein
VRWGVRAGVLRRAIAGGYASEKKKMEEQQNLY